MPNDDAVIVFTSKSVKTLLEEGGTSKWRLDPTHARQCTYSVCTRNAYGDADVPGPEPHGAAFLIGKNKDVVPAPSKHHGPRFLIRFSEYALVDMPGVWKGNHNPVAYKTLEELGIDPTILKWQPMPESTGVPEAVHVATLPKSTGGVQPLTMSDAKNGLALTFGVAPEAIEITIRG
jgi:hypothetical protein